MRGARHRSVALSALAVVLLSACSGADSGKGGPKADAFCPAGSGTGTLPLVSPTTGAVLAVFHGVLAADRGDVDGDGRSELVVLWRPAADTEGLRHAGSHARIWVLRVRDDGIEYVWRGSAMSAQALAFGLVEHEGHHRLITLEAAGGGKIAVCYDWTGFGFSGKGTPVGGESEFYATDGKVEYRCVREGNLLQCRRQPPDPAVPHEGGGD